MTEEFTFNARQYFDFSKENEDVTDDSFFEVDQEGILQDVQEITIKTVESFEEVAENEISDPESESVFFSPMVAVAPSSTKIFLKSKMRRSLSLNQLPINDEQQTHVELEKSLSNLQVDNRSKLKAKCSSTHSLNRVKSASREHINRLAQPKSFKSQEKQTDYMTLAEAVNKFQAGTPKRFRTTPKIKKGPLQTHLTKPQSPKLMTTTRARPPTAISTEEQQQLEFEEAKKFKIKANPVNKKILRGPLKPQVLEKKPATVVEPFHITEVKKKENVEIAAAPVFHAQPVPKSLHEPFKIQKLPPHVTEAHTPKFSKRFTKPPSPKVELKKNDENTKPVKLTSTHLVPFSFEKRDLELKKKKEEFIAKTIEEEKKAREFHANPLPKSILKTRNGSLGQITHTSDSSRERQRSLDSLDKPAINTFKARPADVLKMKPFEPKKEHRVTQFEEFRFNTDERVDAWQKYEQKRKEKEEMIAEHKKRQEEELLRQEEEEKARIRKQAEHKAQPIKKYKPVVIEPSNKVTEPVSFHFHTDRIRNQEHVA